jgi:RNA polymerase sigma factor (sigma-70 family)
MLDTPCSLLERLRHHPDEAAWKRLVELYTPLIRRWLGQSGVNGSDSDDLMQDVFTVLVHKLPSFEHNQQRGAFRYWLRSILVNRMRRHWDAKRTTLMAAGAGENLPALEALEDPASDLNQLWDREHDAFLARRVVQIIENDFNPSTWEAFRRVVLDGAKPSQVAGELGLSVNAVLLAKSRVLRRARQEIDGLID